MCVETCVKISDKSDKKWRSYCLYKLSSCVTRGVYKSAISLGQSYRLQGGRGGVMVKCIAFSYGSCLLMLYLPSGANQTSIHGHQTSVTQETSWREVAQYVLLSVDLSLPSLSDISKVDCAGGKFKLLPEYLSEREVWWLILQRKSHALP